MDPDSVSASYQPVAIKYLEHIEALAAEIRVGMTAVGADMLVEFEESVAKQQQLCMSLCRLNVQIAIEETRTVAEMPVTEKMVPAAALVFSPRASDRILAERIQQAAQSLQALNGQYAALLKHSGDSVRLFAGLCQSYTGPSAGSSFFGASRSTWNCEL